MRIKTLWVALHIIAAAVPFTVFSSGDSTAKVAEFAGWPESFNGRALERMELTRDEKSFSRGFPGHIARFTDGSSEIIMRRLTKESRKLHPAADCMKGAGFKVEPLPIRSDSDGRHWGCVLAVKDEKKLRVCEIIYDEEGRSWSDVSSWYWSAKLKRTKGPWWAITVASKELATGTGQG
ncbi:MAG: hypothetical protein V3T30_00010 [Thermodesulfobacteriota bacterium]